MAEALVRRFHPLHIARRADTSLPGGQVSALRVVEDTASGSCADTLGGRLPERRLPCHEGAVASHRQMCHMAGTQHKCMLSPWPERLNISESDQSVLPCDMSALCSKSVVVV